MNTQRIEKRRKKLNTMREKIEQGQLNAFRELLTNEAIEQICSECQYYFRTRLLSPLVTIFHMIAAAISREGSFQSAWHLNGQTAQSGSLAKARKRLPLSVWQKIHHWIVDQIKQHHDSQYLWHGHRVFGQDGTCVSMSDEPQLVTRFGKCRTQKGPSRFPVARVVIVFNLHTLITMGHEMDRYTVSETELADRLISRFNTNDILVGDRRFAGALRYFNLMQNGLHFVNRSHQSLRLERLEIPESFSSADFIVKMPIPKLARKQDPTLPEFIPVRMIQTTAPIRGKKQTFWIATSLLDPKKYAASEIQTLYKKRWRVETLIEELKVWLSADILRSKTVDGVEKEMTARIIASNLIHWLILKSAKKHPIKLDRISVSATLRLATAYSLKMSNAPSWQLWPLYEQLLQHVAHSVVPYRPDRIEPRMQKREHRHYPKLKMPRSEWKQIFAMAA